MSLRFSLIISLAAVLVACGGGGGSTNGSGGNGSSGNGGGGAVSAAKASCDIPTKLDISSLPHSIVGSGTAESCMRDTLASAVAQGGYITFNCGSNAKTISITPEISVNSTTTTVIDGGGAVTLDGGGANRIFNVDSFRTLSVRNLTLQNAYSVPPANESPVPYSGGAIAAGYLSKVEIINSTLKGNKSGGGGAIYIGSAGMLTVVDSTFTDNTSWYGGAILGMLSGINVVNSNFSGNTAPKSPGGDFGMGGAITTDGASLDSFSKGGIGSGGTISLCGATFKNNSSHNGAGAVWLWAYAPDTIIVKNSTFEDNTVTGIGGAGRISIGPTDHSHQNGVITTPGTISISGSSFLSNSATQGNGGALYMDCYGDCNVSNSTFYGNSAGGVGAAIQHVGWGTDVGTQATTVNFNNVTFADNTGGGSTLFGDKFVLNNTVLISHTTQSICSDKTNTGNNILQYSSLGTTTGCTSSGKFLASDPLLSAPADNGGPTHTMLPSPASPLLHAGVNCLPIDQRGNKRNAGVCDIGSVEAP